MKKTITLYIQDNRDLRIAKNFLIISILLSFLNSGISMTSYSGVSNIFFLITALFSFCFSVGGVYKISKLGRSQNLFKYYMLLILSGIVLMFGTAILFKLAFDIWIFDLHKLDTNTINEFQQDNSVISVIVSIAMIVVYGFALYWAYQGALEFTRLSGDRSFINGIKIILVCILLFFLGNIMIALSGQMGKFLIMLSFIGIFVGGLVFCIGVFRLKQITYIE